MYRQFFISLLITSSLSLFSGSAYSQWDISGSVSAEVRFFPDEPAFPEQNDASSSASAALEPEFVYEWNNEKDRLTFTPFGRWDAVDNNRSHGDVREASWLHLGDSWDLVAGVGKVFWGVTESRHLVDIVNQNDGVEDIDGEDKLGQTMININLNQEWGTVSVFVLPGFRERTFPDDDARLRGPLPIDVDNATYESDDKEQHIDGALRWSHTMAQWDVGLAHFRGTSREPLLVQTLRNGQLVLVPHYNQINQTSLDVQLTTESTLWKLEALTRSGQGDRFHAVVGGLEHTFYGIFATKADLGVLLEYLYDGRDLLTAPAVAADDDVFIGARLTMNNAQDTAFLAGAIVDRNDDTRLYSIEAEQRIGDRWKLELEARFFSNIPDDNLFAGIRDDDFITLRISQFF